MKTLAQMIDALEEKKETSNKEAPKNEPANDDAQTEVGQNAAPLEPHSAAADRPDDIEHLPFSLLDSFAGDPFREYDGPPLEALTESIREVGILSPLLVRPKPAGRYEILSGRHRKKAGILAGLGEGPCIVRRGISEDEAILVVTESNLSRQKLLYGELDKPP